MSEQELEIRDACRRGDIAAALTRLLDQYGPQLLGYLTATAPRDRAREIYAVLVEDLWRGLPAFEWRCSARAWAYAVARNARARCLSAEARLAVPHEPAWLHELVDRTRSPTPAYLRTEVKDGLRAVRERLAERDQTLLMLRVDRDLSWRELVMILDEQRDGEDVAVAEARLRKRFQAVKERLRTLMRREGLLERDGD